MYILYGYSGIGGLLSVRFVCLRDAGVLVVVLKVKYILGETFATDAKEMLGCFPFVTSCNVFLQPTTSPSSSLPPTQEEKEKSF